MVENNNISLEEQVVINNYRRFKDKDPYPGIAASLLNSADIQSYVQSTGMVYPFYEKDLKSASYAARIAGECRYWDEKEKTFKTIELKKKGDKLVLQPNAIAFVGIEPKFRLPDYIAIRFNLKITHVYRGLLLGTGPLIDPGFEGKITIPLHNLTSNEYVFKFKESLIWIEFTKTSQLPGTEKSKDEENNFLEFKRCRNYKSFPEDKKNQPLSYYLDKALENNSSNMVISSIPAAVNDAQEAANSAKKYTRNIAIGSFIAVLALFLSIGSLVYNSWKLQRDYINHIDINQRNKLYTLEQEVRSVTEQQRKRIVKLEKKIDQLENKQIKKTENIISTE